MAIRAGAACLALCGIGVAHATVTSGVAGGTLTVTSDAADAITVTCDGGNVRINGADPSTGIAPCAGLAGITVNGGPGANVISLVTVGALAFPAVVNVVIDGGDGNDTITGSSFADFILAGPGDDVVDGRPGNDAAFLGVGADQFVWNPGDGSDVIEGQSEIDVLRFNGSNASENLALAPNGGRVRVTRDIANVTLDMNDVEAITLVAQGGTDNVAVGDLDGTDVGDVTVALAPTSGVADGVVDTVTITGTGGADSYFLSSAFGILFVTRDAGFSVGVSGPDAALDRVVLDMAGGGDVAAPSPLIAGVVGVTIEGGAGTDRVDADGTTLDDVIGFTANAGVVSATLQGGAWFATTAGVETIELQALGGNDTIAAGNGFAGASALRLHGGPGNDTITGGDFDDMIFGDEGNDVLVGARGNDVVFGGANDDRFTWVPGEGSDVLEGEDGNDTLEFTGSNANEQMAIAANGGRVRLTRDIANVVMDLDDTERLIVRALGGADTLTINDLDGTDVLGITAVLDASAGGSDGAADRVVLNGGSAADVVSFSRAGSVVLGAIGSRTLRIEGAAAAQDVLDLRTQTGGDQVTIANEVAAITGVVVDTGAASDVVTVVGTDDAETYTIAPNGGNATVSRSSPSGTVIDIAASERIVLDAGAGADLVTTQFLATIAQTLDGRAPTTFPGDRLVVNGFGGDVAASPLTQAGAQPITHQGFEFGTFSANVVGAQVVPRTNSPAFGTAVLTLSPTGDTMSVGVNFNSLQGDNTLLHVHGPARRGVNGRIIATLAPSGTTSGSIVTNGLAITPQQRDQITQGLMYIDVHSTAFDDGEIRGQFDNALFADGFE